MMFGLVNASFSLPEWQAVKWISLHLDSGPVRVKLGLQQGLKANEIVTNDVKISWNCDSYKENLKYSS